MAFFTGPTWLARNPKAIEECCRPLRTRVSHPLLQVPAKKADLVKEYKLEVKGSQSKIFKIKCKAAMLQALKPAGDPLWLRVLAGIELDWAQNLK